jgi:hypothetical protein
MKILEDGIRRRDTASPKEGENQGKSKVETDGSQQPGLFESCVGLIKRLTQFQYRRGQTADIFRRELR